MIVIDGPAALDGELKVQGAKNSTLPLLAATVLCKGQTVLHNCPHLSDVDTAVRILEHLGSRCQWQGEGGGEGRARPVLPQEELRPGPKPN